MRRVGGTTKAILSQRTYKPDDMGISGVSDKPIARLRGYLDFIGGGQRLVAQARILEDSTHIFICDFQRLPTMKGDLVLGIGERTFEVTYIDDPMEMHRHLEIYLAVIA